MVVLLFVIINLTTVLASRPRCLTNTHGVTTLAPVFSYGEYNATLLTRVLPEFDIARTSLTLRQQLYVASTNFTRIQITPPAGKLYNDTYVDFNTGLFVNTHMLRPLDGATYCNEPLGIAFGDQFEFEPIMLFTVTMGNQYGNWPSNNRPISANVTIILCTNGTLCASPAFPRWGPSGTIAANDGFICHGNYSYYDKYTIDINTTSSRFNLAFRYVDGDLLIYYSRLGSTLDLNVPYKLIPYRRVPIGFKPKRSQFFQAYMRNTGNINDQRCASYTVGWYTSTIQLQELLAAYDGMSNLDNAVLCSNDAYTELQCLLNSFTPNSGVYSLSTYRSQPTDFVRLTTSESECLVPYDVLSHPPMPFAWQRFQLKGCNFDFNKLVVSLPTKDFWCSGVSPERLSSLCYGSVNLDVMLINSTHLNDLKANVPDPFSRYNYRLPNNFYGCVHTYYLSNSTSFKYTVVNDPSWFTEIAPGGRPDNNNNNYLNTLTYSAPDCTGFCYGMVVISLTVASGTSMVCPIGNDTAFITNQCVNYNIFGYQGTGVILPSNETLPSNKVFSVDNYDSVSLFRYNSSTYSLQPCAYAPISAAVFANYSTALVFNNLPCADRTRAIVEPVSSYWRSTSSNPQSLDTTIGCVVNVLNATSTVVTDCPLAIGGSYCLVPPLSKAISNQLQLVTFNPLANSGSPITPVYLVEIPTNFTLSASTEYIQTYSSKITIDCAKYLCGDSQRCNSVLLQYGTFCTDVNTALNKVFSLLDTSLTETFSSLRTTAPANFDYIGDYNFTSLVGCISNCGISYRSALTDLLYSKVSVADPGFMQAYQKCLDAQWGGNIRDLVCTQTFNGISVLPPIVSPSMQALYTSALVGGIAATGFTFGVSSAATIPFATQLQFRLNGLGVTTNVLFENQKLIANAFNKALVSIQNGFTATNQAFSKIQVVVNHNALQLQALVQQLSNTFGAVSASVNEIYSRLDELEANAQVDRLINGRMVVLNTYVTQLLVQASELRAQAQLAQQKMSECVKSQSSRNDFCGNGTHIFSIPQVAPNGILFIHYSYKPTTLQQVYTTAGLCYNSVGYVPIGGLFVRERNDSGVWYFTKVAFYNPVNLTNQNTLEVAKCGLNYTSVNYTVLTPEQPIDFDFEKEFDKYFKNQSSHLNISFDTSQFNATLLSLNAQMAVLDNVVKDLNSSFIDLKKLSVYTQTIKWPWYAWLGMIAGLVGLCLAVVMLCCMTNCCSGLKGVCSCRQCQYDDYTDIYPAVRIAGKRTV